MFDFTFRQNGAVLLVFRFDENTGSPPVLIEGDDSWFDYNFQPPDPTGNPVSIYSDPDAYASAIAAVYSSNGIIVDVQKTGGLPPEPPSDFAVPVSRSVGTIELDEDKELSGWWRRFWALFIDGIIISLIIGALGAAVIGIIPGGASVETKNTTTITGPDQSVPIEQTLPQGTQVPQYTTGDTGETGDTGQTDYNYELSDDDKAGIAAFFAIIFGTIFLFFFLIYMFVSGIYYGLTMRRANRNGQSFGKQIMGIAVTKEDGQPVTFWFAVLRQIIVIGFLINFLLSAFTLGIGYFVNYLWPLWDKNNQALHDKIVGSKVIRSRDA